MATQLFLVFVIFSLLSLSFSLPTSSVLNATKVLSTSGFSSMALILEFGSDYLIAQTPFITIFCPTDAAFIKSGQPPLSLLHFHFSPLLLDLVTLKSMPPGTKIPTLFFNHSLIVTSSSQHQDDEIFLNRVKVNALQIYSDPNLIVYGIEDFLNPNFESIPNQPPPTPDREFQCYVGNQYWFDGASRLLRSSGYSIMASFLDLQLALSKEITEITIFAPGDRSMAAYIGNMSIDEYSSIYIRHVVPCKILGGNLTNMKTGTLLPTFLRGTAINITTSGDNLVLNGAVSVTASDMYSSGRMVVHGVSGVLAAQERREEEIKPPAPYYKSDTDSISERITRFMILITAGFSLLAVVNV